MAWAGENIEFAATARANRLERVRGEESASPRRLVAKSANFPSDWNFNAHTFRNFQRVPLIYSHIRAVLAKTIIKVKQFY